MPAPRCSRLPGAGPTATARADGQLMRPAGCRPGHRPALQPTTSSPAPSCCHADSLHGRWRTPARRPLARPAAFLLAPPAETAAAARAAAGALLAVPAQRDAAAAALAAILALTLVKACDLAATRDWLDRVRDGGCGVERARGKK
jgi:hypothetical protein